MFSGSVLPNSGDNYKGVGLELVGGAIHFLDLEPTQVNSISEQIHFLLDKNLFSS